VPRKTTKEAHPAGNPEQPAAVPHESYPLKTVSRLTGLSADIIRAWERRYAVVAPLRGPRSARLYSSDDVARLRLLGNLVASGRSIGDVAQLGPEALQTLVNGSEPAEAKSVPAGAKCIPDVLAALQDFDAVRVERLLGDALVGLGTARFLAEVGAPLLERIGEMWAAGKLTVAEEHLASASIRNLFGGLIRTQTVARRPDILLTTPSGERHELGLSIVTLLCLLAGLSVACAGADLPADEIVSAARATKVRVVGLSAVSSENRERAADELRRLEAELPRDVEIWLGGRDAAQVAAAVPGSRAVVLQTLPAIGKEIARVAGRHAA
jgi:DNA-binding transcriptional MerR regulator/methylmalonyl-CoA mutase cobalamin-binding subunit